jgi:ATP-dependent RNA helicase SUPV3L1/SUV3
MADADHATPDAAATVPAAVDADVVAEAAQAPPPAAEMTAAPADDASAVGPAAAAGPDAAAAPAVDAGTDPAAEAAAVAPAPAPAEPETAPAMVEVWRPAGHPPHQRPRHDRNARPRGQRPQGGAEGEGAGRRPRRPDHRNKPRVEAEAGTPEATGESRPARQRFAGKGKPKFRGAKEFGGGRERAERDRPIDPNSPFAKLAALKEQLAANRKDG